MSLRAGLNIRLVPSYANPLQFSTVLSMLLSSRCFVNLSSFPKKLWFVKLILVFLNPFHLLVMLKTAFNYCDIRNVMSQLQRPIASAQEANKKISRL